MNRGVIAAILRKDLVAFSRDRFFTFITVLGVVFIVIVYWVLPSSVDETIRLGVTESGLDTVIDQIGGDAAGLFLRSFPDEEALTAAVEDGTDGIVAGIVFPPTFVDDVAAGSATVRLLVPADVPPEYRSMMDGFVSEIAYAIAGASPPVDLAADTVILGRDRVGAQVSLQDQMRPLLAFIVLLMETFALSSLVAIEVQQRTVTAVLVTPARTRDFIAAKGILGTGLAFGEATLVMLLIGGFAVGAPVLLVALLLGAVLVTGIGMVSGAYGKDFMGVMFVSLAFMIPLMIPAFGALFPGSAAVWVQALPTYGLVQTIVGVTTRSESWAQVAPALGALAAWGAVAFAAGTFVLRRRVATL